MLNGVQFSGSQPRGVGTAAQIRNRDNTPHTRILRVRVETDGDPPAGTERIAFDVGDRPDPIHQ